MHQPRETYYSAFLPFFIVCVGTGVMAGVLLIGTTAVVRGDTIVWGGVAAGVAAGFVVGLVLTGLAIAVFPVFVVPSGVRSYNLWGLYRTVAWAEIASVGRLNLLGLRYLVVRSSQGGSVYVPLFLTEVRRFQESVEEKAGADSPLARALKERLG